MNETVLIILACAIATYCTRCGGYLLVSRFGKLNHRVEAALDAVPTAVLTAIVAPSLVTHGLPETLSILIAGLVAMRYTLQVSVAAGLVSLVVLRMVI